MLNHIDLVQLDLLYRIMPKNKEMICTHMKLLFSCPTCAPQDPHFNVNPFARIP